MAVFNKISSLSLSNMNIETLSPLWRGDHSNKQEKTHVCNVHVVNAFANCLIVQFSSVDFAVYSFIILISGRFYTAKLIALVMGPEGNDLDCMLFFKYLIYKPVLTVDSAGA